MGLIVCQYIHKYLLYYFHYSNSKINSKKRKAKYAERKKKGFALVVGLNLERNTKTKSVHLV
jgi:hypothetical protein